MKQVKIFTIGSATFDIFVRPNDQEVMELTSEQGTKKRLCLEYGAKIRADEVCETFGGGATNTAVGFARLGFDANPIVKVGKKYGDRVIENLSENNVNTKFVQETKRDKTAFSVILNTFDGDRTVLAYAGANQYLTAKDLPLDDLATADWIFLGHLANPTSGIPKAILTLLKKNPHIKLAWNPGHEQFLQGAKKWKALLKNTEILFLNKEEASEFTRLPYECSESANEKPQCHIHSTKGFLPHYADDVTLIMRELLNLGTKHVVITDGRNGSQATDGNKLFFAPVGTSKRVDTLGAGDSFATGFTYATALGKGLKAALSYGTLNATSVISHYGAQVGLLNAHQIQSAYTKNNLCITNTKLSK